MDLLDRAKELSSRGMSEQLEMRLFLQGDGSNDGWLTIAAEYDRLEAQAEGEPITDKLEASESMTGGGT